MIKSRTLWITVGLSLVSIALLTYLTNTHIQLKFGSPSGDSFCNINEVLNCDKVNTSNYATLWDRPISLWGLATQALLLIFQLSLLAGLIQRDRSSFTGLFVGSFFVGAVSFIMAVISVTQLNQYCLFCILTYLSSWAILGLLWVDLKPRMSDLGDFFSSLFRERKYLGLYLLAAPLISFAAYRPWIEAITGIDPKMAQEILVSRLHAWKAAPIQKFDNNLGLIKGNPEAALTMIEFADFRCGHCKALAPKIQEYLKNTNQVKFVFKTYPLDGTCNPNPIFNGQGDGISCRLAAGLICAESLGQEGWIFHDKIFEQQSHIHAISLMDKVDQLLCGFSSKIKCEDFKDCMDSQETMNQIKLMAQEGLQAGIKGTPALYIGGRNLPDPQGVFVLKAIVEEATKNIYMPTELNK